MTTARHKLDPKLRWLREEDFQGKRLKDIFVDVFIEVANFPAVEWLKAQRGVRHVVHLVDGYYTAKIRGDRVAKVASGEGIVVVEAVRYLVNYLDHSIKAINGQKPPESAPAACNEGHGVVIGIIDYGLDVTLRDFRNPANKGTKDAHNPDGLTRVAYLWDQGLSDSQFRAGDTTPAKYRYGVEYSSRDIDAALRARDFDRIRQNTQAQNEPAIFAHGTHVAGIAAGNGYTADDDCPAGTYVGVAPAATLVFVSLSRGDVLQQAQAPAGTLANSVNLAHAIAYCFEKADELGMPCVVNLSVGFNGGGHDGNMVVEWIIDTLLQKPGRAVVLAAGNEHGEENSIHARLVVKRGDEAVLAWDIGAAINGEKRGDPDANELEIWYRRGGHVNVSLIAPDGERSNIVEPDDPGNDFFKFSAGENVRIQSDAVTAWEGSARIQIRLDPDQRSGVIRFGTWKVCLELGPGAPDKEIVADAWIERTVPARGAQSRSRLTDYDPESAITLTTPGSGRLTITVASQLNDGNPLAPIAASSGRGPTRDGRFKPELAAPGEVLVSSHRDAGTRDEKGRVRPARACMEGTSMAAPHVTGVIARMLSRNAYLRAKDIRKILFETAVRRPAAKLHAGSHWPWDRAGGYGTVNAAAAVARVEELVGTAPSDGHASE